MTGPLKTLNKIADIVLSYRPKKAKKKQPRQAKAKSKNKDAWR